MARSIRHGFTLVEVLVVIAIIGVLIALLLPALQAARESARRVACADNLRKLALACIRHEDQQKAFPSGGRWNWAFTGDSSQGFGREQRGSWLFSALAFTDYGDVWLLAKQPDNVDFGLMTTAKLSEVKIQIETPIPIFNCPSRRSPQTYPMKSKIFWSGVLFEKWIRADYAANTGHEAFAIYHPSLTDNSSPTVSYETIVARFPWSGVIYHRSEVSGRMISDGLTKTLLIGEKYVDSNHYRTGLPDGDNTTANQGFCDDNLRILGDNDIPIPDTDSRGRQDWFFSGSHNFNEHYSRGALYRQPFGSAHFGIWQAAFCDGSVTQISYSLDINVGKKLANRRDGQYVDRP